MKTQKLLMLLIGLVFSISIFGQTTMTEWKVTNDATAFGRALDSSTVVYNKARRTYYVLTQAVTSNQTFAYALANNLLDNITDPIPYMWTAYKVDSIHQSTSYKSDFYYAYQPIIVDSIIVTLEGGGATPSITPKLGYGLSSSSLTYLINSPTAATGTITKYSTFNKDTIPQGNRLFTTFSAIGEAVKEFTIYIIYHTY